MPLSTSKGGIRVCLCRCLEQDLKNGILRLICHFMLLLIHSHIKYDIYIISNTRQLHLNGGKVRGEFGRAKTHNSNVSRHLWRAWIYCSVYLASLFSIWVPHFSMDISFSSSIWCRKVAIWASYLWTLANGIVVDRVELYELRGTISCIRIEY